MDVFVNALSVRDGGGITFINSLIGALARLDSDVRYAVFTPPSVFSEFKRIDSLANIDLIPIKHIQRSVLRRIWWEQTVLPRLAVGRENGVLLSPGNVCCFLWRGPQVLVVQSIAPFCRDAQRGKGAPSYLRYSVLNLLTRLSFHAADVVVVNSDATRLIALRNGCPPARIRVIPLGRSEVFSQYPISQHPIEQQTGHVPEERYILTVGVLSRHKNLEVLIEAIAQLRQRGYRWPLRIVGASADQRYLAYLKGLVSTCEVADLVEFIGHVSYSQLPRVYASAGVFVLTSLVENFPHTLVEAMSMGCPIVSSRQIPTREACGDAAVECDARNPSDVAFKIEQVMTDAGLRAGMRAHGLARANHLDWSRLAGEYLILFRQLVGAVKPEGSTMPRTVQGTE